MVGFLLLLGISYLSNQKQNLINETVKVKSHSWQRSKADTLEIGGILKNGSPYTLDYAEVDFSIYDKEGNLVQTRKEIEQNIAAGESWKFTVQGLSDDTADTYKITNVSAH